MLQLPDSSTFHLRNARVAQANALPEYRIDQDGFATVDLTITDGWIASIAPSGARPHDDDPATTVDLGGRVVLPTFADCHTHLDKGHIWTRAPNPDGSFPSALDAVARDTVRNWAAHDVKKRMEFGLRCAYHHGTGAVRTHIDSQAPQDQISWPVFEELRDAWGGRVTLQGVCLIGIEQVRDTAFFNALVKRVSDAGGILGAVAYMVPDIESLLERVFEAAIEHGLDLDFHADETGDPESIALRLIAETALRKGYDGHVLVGHCCSVARQAPDDAMRTLDLVARARLNIVTLPTCNLYLQDRRLDGTTPRWRGVTLVHEMRARGIPVAIASDNTRDPFYPFGDLDMHEVFRMATRILHLDHPSTGWSAAATAVPADIMRLPEAGRLEEGGVADMVIFQGRNWNELMSRPEAARIVVRGGKQIASTLPAYAELDLGDPHELYM